MGQLETAWKHVPGGVEMFCRLTFRVLPTVGETSVRCTFSSLSIIPPFPLSPRLICVGGIKLC
jgi:hypothetical protein